MSDELFRHYNTYKYLICGYRFFFPFSTNLNMLHGKNIHILARSETAAIILNECPFHYIEEKTKLKSDAPNILCELFQTQFFYLD